MAYHFDKIERKFTNLINILGADHTGYIKRISAAVSALSEEKVKLNCKVCQLVKLYKNGKPFKMSKRAGEFISAQELLNEVDKDSIRFMMLNRSNDVELDFDFDKLKKEQKITLFFMFNMLMQELIQLSEPLKDLNDKILAKLNSFEPNEYEEKFYEKYLNGLKLLSQQLINLNHKIPFYLYELSTLFHSYWSKGNEEKKFRLIENGELKRNEALVFIYLVAIVIQNGMNILGVSLPKKM